MISIQECNTDLDSIAKEHLDFIVESLHPIISFYLEVFSIRERLTAHSRHTKITKRIKTIPNIHGKTKISLLTKLFINKSSVSSLENSWKIKRDHLLIVDALNTNQILHSLEFLSQNLEEILSINLNESGVYYSTVYNTCRTNLAPINFLLNTIFNYGWFIDLELKEKWSAYKLSSKLDIKICPYCNRQRTFTVINNNEKITRPEFDHFLPKNEHPILALNFYNLIPSCTVCNRDLKGSIPFSYDTHLSPYEENKEHQFMKFDYRPLSYDGAAGITEEIEISVSPNIGLNQNLKQKVEGNISVFKFDEVNVNLRDIAQEIIYKRYISGDDYIQVLKKTFPKAHLTDREAYKIAYGNYFDEKDFSKRPLSKMTKDIAYHIGALKPFK